MLLCILFVLCLNSLCPKPSHRSNIPIFLFYTYVGRGVGVAWDEKNLGRLALTRFLRASSPVLRGTVVGLSSPSPNRCLDSAKLYRLRLLRALVLVDQFAQRPDLLLQPVPQLLLLLLLLLLKPVHLKLIHLFLPQRMALLVYLIFSHRTP